MNGSAHSDGQFMVGDNGQAANEQIVTRMSKATKEQIEAEIETLGFSGWQEFMAHLINGRNRIFMPQAAPAFAEKSNSKPVQKSLKTNWLLIGILGIVVIGLIAFLVKKRGFPKISFA